MEREEGTSVEPEWSIMSRLDEYFILRERERERERVYLVWRLRWSMDWENHFSNVSCSTLPKGLSMEWDLMSYSTPDHYTILLNRRLSEKSPFSSK